MAAMRRAAVAFAGVVVFVLRVRAPCCLGFSSHGRCNTASTLQRPAIGGVSRLPRVRRSTRRLERFAAVPVAGREAPAGRDSAGSSAVRAAEADSATAERPGAVFVSVVAFSDPELPVTLRSMLLQAKHPERLYVGLVWQGFDGEDPLSSGEIQDLCELWRVSEFGARAYENSALAGIFNSSTLPLPAGREYSLTELAGGHVRLLKIRAEDARGPCWARYLAQHLWAGEEFYMQIDSHMRFVRNWDAEAHKQLAWCATRSEKPVLSTYGRGYALGTPPDWDPPEDASTPELICAGFFDSNKVLNIQSRRIKHLENPRPNPFWSGHFSFSSSQILREVPYDPQCLMLLFGEEPLMATRLFTHGWDVYTPTRGLLFHLWTRDYRRTFFEMKQLYAELLPRTLRRVFWLQGAGPPPPASEQQTGWPLPGGPRAPEHGASDDAFGLGAARTLAEYERFADVSFRDRHVGDSAQRAGLPSDGDYFVVKTAAAPPPDDASNAIFFLICGLPVALGLISVVQPSVAP